MSSEYDHYRWFRLGRDIESIHQEINLALSNEDNRNEKLCEVSQLATDLEINLYEEKNLKFEDALMKYDVITWLFCQSMYPDLFCERDKC